MIDLLNKNKTSITKFHLKVNLSMAAHRGNGLTKHDSRGVHKNKQFVEPNPKSLRQQYQNHKAGEVVKNREHWSKHTGERTHQEITRILTQAIKTNWHRYKGDKGIYTLGQGQQQGTGAAHKGGE